jgi:antirestriction protein ArdC
MAYRNHRNAASRPNIYQTVTDRIISSLKAGMIPWEKPWKTPRYAGGPFPRNFYTGNRLIVHAAANAQRAVDLILGNTFEEETETTEMSGMPLTAASPQPLR